MDDKLIWLTIPESSNLIHTERCTIVFGKMKIGFCFDACEK